jgi:hypothetical protein
MAIPTPWMPLLIEQKWLTPQTIGRFAALTPVVGSSLLMIIASLPHHGMASGASVAMLLLLPALILSFFFLDALKRDTPWSAIRRFTWRSAFWMGLLGGIAGFFIGPFGGALVGFLYGMVVSLFYTVGYLPILGWVSNISKIPAHDTPNRLLLAVSIWFGTLLSLVSLLLAYAFEVRALGWIGQFLSISLILIAIARDVRLRKVLVQLYDGKLPGIELVSRATLKLTTEQDLLPLVSGNGAFYDGIVTCKVTQEEGPFRSSQGETALALCPLDRRAGLLIINRRIRWGVFGLFLLYFIFLMTASSV